MASVFAIELGALVFFTVPAAFDEALVGLWDTPAERDKESESVLGGGNGVSRRGVHHDDPAACRCGLVDVVDADSGAADGAELVCGFDDFGGNRGLRADDKGIVISDIGEDFVFGAPELHIDVELGISLEFGDASI